MRAVHGVSRLERDHFPPTKPGKFVTEFSRGETKTLEVIMGVMLYSLDSAADIPGISFVKKIVYPGVNGTGGTEHGFRFSFAVRLPDLFNMQDPEHNSFGITQSDFAFSRSKSLGKLLRDVQCDGHRPEETTLKFHVLADTLIIR